MIINNPIVTFTNGCWDLLHFGHLQFLEELKKYCDVLVVGVNSDYSVTSLKGEKRPYIPVYERARLIGALGCVDQVVVFDELTACNAIREICPDYYAKSIEYKDSNIPEFTTAMEVGAKIMLVTPEPYAKDLHTSSIVKRIIDKELGR